MNKKVGRNDPCPCGSGKKFKKCCLLKIEEYTRLGGHEKRMREIGAIAVPPPGTKAHEKLMRLIESSNEKISKEDAKKLFRAAFTKVTGYLFNGANLMCDKTLRYFYQEYNDRLFKAGLWSFPASFNVVEAFITYVPPLNFFKLKDEQDFIFSIDDYMDFVTSDKCIGKLDEALGYFEEGKIYHFNNADDPRKSIIKNNLYIDYGFAGVSVIRHADELSIIMVLGELTDMRKADKLVHESYPKALKSKHPAKKNLKPSDDFKLEAARLGGIEGLWQTIVLTRFDLSKRTQHVRYILKDRGKSFVVYTDDPSIFSSYDTCDHDETVKNMLSKLCDNNVLFELCKISMYLPYYFEVKCDSVISERHPTDLKSNLTSSEIKNHIELKDKLFYRNVSVLESSAITSPNIRTVKAPELKIESSGFWKHLSPGQKGVDKNGNVIHGKTWVEKRLSWVESENDKAFSVFKDSNIKEIDAERSGYIYVMRSAAHDKDIFKIGATKRSSEIRSDELSRTTGSPDKFLVAEEWQVKDCFLAEKLIHEKLKEYRINPSREFFKIPYSEIIKEIENVIKELNF